MNTARPLRIWSLVELQVNSRYPVISISNFAAWENSRTEDTFGSISASFQTIDFFKLFKQGSYRADLSIFDDWSVRNNNEDVKKIKIVFISEIIGVVRLSLS